MADNTLYIFTADKVGETGTHSWKYIFDIEPRPDDRIMRVICGVPFGYVSRDLGFCVWEAERGLRVAGGFDEDSAAERQKEMLDGIPSCSLLMTTETFEWLRKHVLERFERPYQRFHHEKDGLFTG